MTSLFDDERGGPLAEMAVLILPFMVMVALIIEGGNLFWRHQISLKAVRDTTRYISRTPLLFDDACNLNGNVLADVTNSDRDRSGPLNGLIPMERKLPRLVDEQHVEE